MTLTPAQQALLQDMAERLSAIPGLEAVALGGSHARGRARPGSDLDIGLYYARTTPFDVALVRALAKTFNDAPSPVVSERGGWGRWVDGGAWLTVGGQRVDWLYRSVDAIEAAWNDALNGHFERDDAQQPPFGFFGPTLLGEICIAQSLSDPTGELARLKALVSHYPNALRASVVQSSLWDADFTLRAFAPKFADRNDAWGAASCMARVMHRLILALFALNKVWLVNDKTALDEIREFPQAPEDFADRINALLASPGAAAESLRASLKTCRTLFSETAALANGLYKPSWTL